MKAIDITGLRFGRLTAVRIAPRVKGQRRRRWECLCDCGNIVIATAGALNFGDRLSCGCYRIDLISTHRATNHALFSTWHQMMTRCYNERCKEFKYYGARGIQVCEQWRTDPHAFFAYIGPKPSTDHSIDRINNDGDYEPGNCRWATLTEQNRNRSTCRKLTFGDRTMVLSEWAAETGIHRVTIAGRLRRGWTIERALTHPTTSGRSVKP